MKLVIKHCFVGSQCSYKTIINCIQQPQSLSMNVCQNTWRLERQTAVSDQLHHESDASLRMLWRCPESRAVKSTWKPYLSKSTDTLQWKLLHYTLQFTNSKTTWVKVLVYLILTVLKYFTYTKYRLKDALVKETWQSKSVTLWRSWGNRRRQGSMCRHFMEKLEQTIRQKPQANRQPLHSTSHKELKQHLVCICCVYRRLINWTR